MRAVLYLNRQFWYVIKSSLNPSNQMKKKKQDPFV
jgi:hypothetical protein